MKHCIPNKLIPAVLTLLMLCSGQYLKVYAQTTSGNIRGQVANADGGTLPGASVMIKGTTRGVTTDLTGNYSILNLKEGNYTLVINYMGFKSIEAEAQIKAGTTVTKNISMTTTSASLENLTVIAAREGQAKALNQQRNSDNIKQVISADLIGRYPDINVAEAMQRLPGVTIGRNSSGEGSTIQLRGTPGNFTNINVNGEQIMGTQEGGERNAQLDVIPVNVLSSMEVVKTLTPDLDGDAIAGVVNMKSPTASNLRPSLSVDLAAGYNNLRSDANGIGNITFGKRFFANNKNPNGKLGFMATGSYFKTTNGYDELNAQVWQKKNFGDGVGEIYFPTDVRYLYVENERTRIGTSATVDFNFSPNTSLLANVMYSTHNNDLVRYRKRTRMQTANTTRNSAGEYVTTRGRGYNEIKNGSEENSNLNFNIQGETVIGRVKLDAGAFLTESEFDNRAGTINFITGNIALTATDISSDYLMASGADWKNGASLFTYNTIERDNWTTNGKNFVARANMSLPYKIGNNSSLFKAGFKLKRMHNVRYKLDNTLVANYTGPAADGRLTNFSGEIEKSGDLLDGNSNFGLAVDRDKTFSYFENNIGGTITVDPKLTQASKDSYFYDAVETVGAGYIMNRIQFNKLMLIAGLRVENTDVAYQGNIILYDAAGAYASTNKIRRDNDYLKLLPNLQAKLDLSKSTLIRGAFTTGYSRPNFVDLVPGRIVNVLNTSITDGNPDLKPASATNYDIMFEKYLSNLGILSAGAFYKNIRDFQYTSVTNITGDEFVGAASYLNWLYTRTLNGDVAHVAGLELNAQANLTFLPGILKGFSILANYTYAYSKADAQERKDIRLPGQAKHTANASLSFAYKGFTIQGNVNYNGSYTVLLGGVEQEDAIRDARTQLDVNTSYRITKRFTIYAEGLNLTNAPQREYFGDSNRIYKKQFYSYWGRAGVKFRI